MTSGYEVAVAGVLGPALRCALADLQPTRRPASTVLRLQIPAGRTVGDVTAMLHDRGLRIIALRAVPDPPGPL